MPEVTTALDTAIVTKAAELAELQKKKRLRDACMDFKNGTLVPQLAAFAPQTPKAETAVLLLDDVVKALEQIQDQGLLDE